MISHNPTTSDDQLLAAINAAWPGSECPEPALFLEEAWAALDAQEQMWLDAHVATCAACQVERKLAQAFRAETGDAPNVRALARKIQLTDSAANLEWAPTASTWWPRLAAAAVGACAIGLGALLLQGTDPLPELPDRGTTAGVTRGSAITLLPQSMDGDAAGELRWTGVDGSTGFVVTVRNAAGDIVLSRSTNQTALALPQTLVGRGGRLVWEVVALDADGQPMAKSSLGVYLAGKGVEQ